MMKVRNVFKTAEDFWEDFNLEVFYLKRKENLVLFGLSSITTMQIIRHLNEDLKVLSIQFMADNPQIQRTITEKDFSVSDPNLYFLKNYLLDKKYFSIKNFLVKFENGVKFHSINDTSGLFTFETGFDYKSYISEILTYNGFDSEVVFQILNDNPQQYVAIEKPGLIKSIHHEYTDLFAL